MDRINVSKPFMPPIEEYERYIQRIWDAEYLTNQGPLLQEFEQRLGQYLDVPRVHVVANGTIALQLALHALGIQGGEIITTPFSYVATTSSILWERCEPVFVDIDPVTLCIDPSKIEAAITPETRAILPVHVFGLACDMGAIEAIAKQHNLKVIYDGAQAFGSTNDGASLLSYGDISIGSFHATKPFHAIEGGCLVVRDDEVSARLELAKRFGHDADDHVSLGINAKMSEFHAAMGLCNLGYIDAIIADRKRIHALYRDLLGDLLVAPRPGPGLSYNYAYCPFILPDEVQLLRTADALNRHGVFPRRYFYPSLNTLPYLKKTQSCPISEDIASRIMCLPLYGSLDEATVGTICDVIHDSAAHRPSRRPLTGARAL